jgi:hypothetical protein
LCALGLGEFVLASLTESTETYRHLFLFHAITDVTVCAAVGTIEPPRRLWAAWQARRVRDA